MSCSSMGGSGLRNLYWDEGSHSGQGQEVASDSTAYPGRGLHNLPKAHNIPTLHRVPLEQKTLHTLSVSHSTRRDPCC